MAGDASGGNSNTQNFSFETVAALVASLMEKNGSLGMKDYELMASLDGARSASSFDHQFRKVKTRAKELLAAKAAGGGSAATTPTKNTKASSKTATPASKGNKSGGKRGRRPAVSDRGDNDDESDASPSKKIKADPEDEEAAANGGAYGDLES